MYLRLVTNSKKNWLLKRFSQQFPQTQPTKIVRCDLCMYELTSRTLLLLRCVYVYVVNLMEGKFVDSLSQSLTSLFANNVETLK